MLNSKQGQSVALGIAMLILWAAAAVHVQNQPQSQNLALAQIDVFPMMSQVRTLPIEAAVQP